MELNWDHRLCHTGSFFLADLLGTERSSVTVLDVPELTRPTDEGQRVELISDVGGRKVSFEHTEIESYSEQIRDGHRLSDFTKTVTERLCGPLPIGTFTLSVATDAVLGITGDAAMKAANQIAEWIDREAPDLANESANEGLGSNRRSLESPISAGLWYRTGDEYQELRFSRSVPPELEAKRQERIAKAYADKLPKLAATRDRGCDPCLILEDRDISLANAHLVLEAAKAALEEFAEIRPEWILLVETAPEPSMWIALFVSGKGTDLNIHESTEIPIPEKLEIELR